MKKSVFLFSMLFFLCCGAYAQRSATINRTWYESNIMRNGKRGMNVYADISVSGMRGEIMECVVFFYDSNYKYIKTSYSGYCSSDNSVCVYARTTPVYDSSRYSEYGLFIPYDAMNLQAGSNTYYYKFFVRDVNSNYNVLASSIFTQFTMVGKNVNVLADGSTVEFVDNGNGTQTMIIKQRCNMCHGTKICPVCNGTGGSTTVPRYSVYWRPCSGCNGTLKCRFCNGTGESVSYMTTNKSTGNYNYYDAAGTYSESGNINSNSGAVADIIVDSEAYSGNLSPERYREFYSKWEWQAESLYNSLVNITKTGDGDIHSNKYGAEGNSVHIIQTKNNLRKVQAEMRKLRNEAAKYGVVIAQSYWETCSPPTR